MHYFVSILVLQFMKGKRMLVALLLLFYRCIVTKMFCGSSSAPLVDLQCVLVVFPDNTHLPFGPWERHHSVTLLSRITEIVSYQICDGGDGSHLKIHVMTPPKPYARLK